MQKFCVTYEEKIDKFSQTLTTFVPDFSADYIARFLIDHVVHFTVSKKRKTKLGDYRQPYNGKPHRISVNGDLNPYAFLVTTVHEMAHLTTFKKYGNRVSPHGYEWKNEFKLLFAPLITTNKLPDDVTIAVKNYLKNAKASSCSDDRLYRVLKRYDSKRGIRVEELEFGAEFQLNGKFFVKGRKLRTRFECRELSSQKLYRVLGLAEIDQ